MRKQKSSFHSDRESQKLTIEQLRQLELISATEDYYFHSLSLSNRRRVPQKALAQQK